MKRTGLKRLILKRCCVRLFIEVLLFSFCISVRAQEPPPRPITVTVNLSQNLNFGIIVHGIAGGSVTVDTYGTRTPTGDVILVGIACSPALFDVTANPGTVISIANVGATFTLTGSNSGTMTLTVGDSDPSPYVTTAIPPAVNTLSIGGTLYVGNALANPPGNYSGTFDVIFIQE